MIVALFAAALLQSLAVVYGIFLLTRRQGATGAWLFLLGGMSSMLMWRIVVLVDASPPQYFNPVIAIWGSTCMVGAMFLFGREVARRRKVEMERDALLNSERAARTDAERTNRLKDEFLATLSHELRTPLAAILGWCEVLRNARARQEDKVNAVATIERNARAQARLIDDLLDVTRMQAGKLHLELAVCALDSPIRAAIQAVQPAADAKGIAIEFEMGATPLFVRADASRLQQVAANLLVNAIKFTDAQGKVTVQSYVDGGYAIFKVTDTGEGIDPEFVPHLFARFTQADSSTSRRHGGLGLGLSIVDHIVRAHEGQVLVHSAGKGQGAAFTVKLPLVSADSDAVAAVNIERPAESLVTATQLTGLRVILIDDEQDVRNVVSRILEQQGAEVFAFSSGVEIETAMVRIRPHVLVVDIGMPNEDGYSLIRRIRLLSDKSGGATPAISLTAHARNEDRARALSSGFQQHLPKPIDVALLTAAIKQVATLSPDDAPQAKERA